MNRRRALLRSLAAAGTAIAAPLAPLANRVTPAVPSTLAKGGVVRSGLLRTWSRHHVIPATRPPPHVSSRLYVKPSNFGLTSADMELIQRLIDPQPFQRLGTAAGRASRAMAALKAAGQQLARVRGP